ncbi:MAG: hypothetical protein ACR65W_03935 [Methylocystis sp.]|uniref:hypothetical protein n=1 Tax=Methylocystis sp. TaxID=1911079 RepID=UPI003DA56FFB
MTPSELRIKNFLKRVPPNAPPAVARNVETALKLADRFSEKAAEIRSNQKLSAQGKREELVVVASKGFAAHYSQLRKEVDKALAGIAGEIGGLKKRAVELLSDGFSAELRREARGRLHMLTPNDRRRLALETDDRLLQAAILEVSPFLAGLDPDIHAAVEQRIVESMFSERLAQLEIEHNAWENASAACTVAADEIAREVGVTREGFGKLARPEAA